MSTDGSEDDDVPVFCRVIKDCVEDRAEDLGGQARNSCSLSKGRSDGSVNTRTCGAIDRHAQLGQFPLNLLAENFLQLSPSPFFTPERSRNVYIRWRTSNGRGAARASQK